MQIERFIYTKVGREESPWNFADFHTVFYPVDLLSREALAAIEKTIHVPDLGRTPYKKALFFQNFGKEDYLILLFLKSLPEARDSFGRGGIFMVQGFLFPPSVWQRVFMPLELVSLVEQHLFTDLDDLLSSDLGDRQTGNIRPVQLSDGKMAELGKGNLNLSETGKKMAQQLINMARGARGSLLLRGKPEEVTVAMNGLFPVLPDQLKVALGWDEAFENANLNLFPLRIAGFMDRQPIAAKAVVLDAVSLTIEQQPENNFSDAETPYQRWLEERSSTVFEKSMVESAWNLSQVLEGKRDRTTSHLAPQELTAFVKANRVRIREAFITRCQDIIGEEITPPLVETCEAEDMLGMLADGFPPAELSERITELVLSSLLVPTRALPQSLIRAAGPELILLNRVWQDRELSAQDFLGIKPEKMAGIFQYLVLGKWRDRHWLTEVLQTLGTMFDQLAASAHTRQAAEKILVTFLRRNRTYKKTAPLIATAAIHLQQGEELLKARVSVEDIIEQGLATGEFSYKQLTTLAKWVRKQQVDRIITGRPFMASFFIPENGVRKEALAAPGIRPVLLNFLLRFHRMADDELARAGFTEEERVAAGGSPSMLSRIGGLFGRR